MAEEGNQQQTQETNVIFIKENTCEGSGTDLDVDSLAEVFSTHTFPTQTCLR